VAKSFEQVKAETDAEYARLAAAEKSFVGSGAQLAELQRGMQAQVAIRDEAAAKQTAGFDAWNKNNPPAKIKSGEDIYYENKAASELLEKQTSARQYLKTLLTQYNMQSLAGQIEGFIIQSTNQEFLAEKVRETSEYKARFKGLVALQARGNTDVRNEAEYLDLETGYRSAFNEAGLRNYLGTDGSQGEYDSIAKLVGDYSVSVEEVKGRIGDAQRVVADTPQEVRDSLQRFYNIDSSALVEYALDPTRSQDKINTLANAAIVGGYGDIAGLDLNIEAAETVSSFANDEDLNLSVLNKQLVEGADVRDATSRLANIDRMELSDSEALLASMDADATAKKKVKGLQSRERARFGGSSGFNRESLKSVNTI
jgi:hypothetical protein